jgi:nitroreductase
MELRKAIETRKTEKVLADAGSPWEVPEAGLRDRVNALLGVATNAPYHKPADESHRAEGLTSIVPWRFHVLDGEQCRKLIAKLDGIDKPAGKIPNMLAAADALVMTTWLPNPSADSEKQDFQCFDPTLQNMEHIAAASAATQNLLLLATEAGWKNYWSSGGILRSKEVYELLQIPESQILIGAIFLFPEDTRTADVKPGGLRDRKGEASQWSRWVSLAE